MNIPDFNVGRFSDNGQSRRRGGQETQPCHGRTAGFVSPIDLLDLERRRQSLGHHLLPFNDKKSVLVPELFLFKRLDELYLIVGYR